MILRRTKKVSRITLGINLTAINEPMSVFTEQIKTIRTNIKFAASEKGLRTLMVTSASVGEGKSTIAANLAIEYAKEGQKVLLVDADLRRPTVHKTFRITNQEGLSSWLSRQVEDINEVVHIVSENLFVMTSGPKPPNPAELLGSVLMNELLTSATHKLDMVIVDAPPVLPVTDSQLLGNKIDGTVLVVRQNVAQKNAVRDAVAILKRSHANILGAVLNDISNTRQNGYYGYTDGYYEEEKE